jgi:AraC-like DNA-binding protein
MKLIRWNASQRVLDPAEVDESFVAHADTTLLFAFTTDAMHVGPHAGPLSFKFVTHGEERYRIGKRTVRLSPGHVLITNAGQDYASDIEVHRTRAISCFLSRSGVSALVAGVRESREPVIDPAPGPDRPCEVIQAPFRPAPALRQVFATLDGMVRRAGPVPLDILEEVVLHAAGLALCGALSLVLPNALGAVRRATRDELVTRVLRAREFIEDRGGRVTLGQMADIATLSPYHFLRVFKAAFGTTPATYARRVRLERGLALVRRGATCERAGRAAGFSSGSVFLRSLRRTRQPPSQACGGEEERTAVGRMSPASP